MAKKAAQFNAASRRKIKHPLAEVFGFPATDTGTGDAPRHKIQQRHARQHHGEGICVIDLDTVMPGLALYDFGDMVRTTTSPAKEDERDLSKVRCSFPCSRRWCAATSRRLPDF